ARNQGFVEAVEDLLLDAAVEVDDHVAAQDQMLLPLGLARDEVAVLEADALLDAGIELVGRPGREPALPVGGWHLAHGELGKAAAPRRVQAAAVDVGSEQVEALQLRGAAE